jgi:hypothetical protein
LTGCRGTHDRSGATSGAEGGAAVRLPPGPLGTFRVLWITLRCGKFFPSLTTYELRFLSYTAADDGRPATAEFAVALLRYEPDAVDVAVVDEERGKTLYKPDLLPVV